MTAGAPPDTLAGLAARPLFVIGSARSGTTLVRALLGAHPEIELRNEPELMLSLMRAEMGPDDVVPREDRLRILFELNRTGLTRQHLAALPPETIEEFLTRREDLGFREVYELLLPRPDREVVWGEKSLGNAYLMREIAALYPDALFVHVLRDPRAATWSWVALHYLEAEGEELPFDQDAIGVVAYTAMRWAGWTDAIDGSAGALPDAALTRVRFEELVQDPAAVLGRVCSALGVGFDERMLDPERRRDDPLLRSRPFAHHRLSGPVDPARASGGDELPSWAAAVVERYAGEAMARHGYPSRGEELASAEREELERELEFLEPILRERLAREPSHVGRVGEGSGAVEAQSAIKADSLAALAATAMRRRGVGSHLKTELEALRALAAAAIDRRDSMRERLVESHRLTKESERRRKEAERLTKRLNARVEELERRVDELGGTVSDPTPPSTEPATSGSGSAPVQKRLHEDALRP
jgi:Sulfotransferase family